MFEDGKRFDQLHIEATREINPHQGTMDFPVHESKTAVTFIGDVCASTIETRIHISHPPTHARAQHRIQLARGFSTSVVAFAR